MGKPGLATASRLSAKQFRAAMEYSPIGTAIVGLDGRWLWANAALRDLLGYSKEELEQLTFQAITHPPDLELDLESVKALLAGEISGYQMEKRYIRKDGSLVWALLTGSLVRDSRGQPDYFFANVQDISDRKAAEIERATLMERLTLATKAGGVGVWEWNIPSGQLIWDARMYELYEVDPDTPLSYEVFASHVHEDDRGRIDRELADATIGVRPFDTEFTIVTSSGTERQLRALATVVHDDGRPTRMIGTNWDVTKVRQLMELAQQSAKSKSQFLATMSHELRTPLNAIIGFSEMLLAFTDRPRLALGPEARHFVELIRDSSATLLLVVNDILDYSRIEAGGFDLDPHEFEVEAVVRGALEIVRPSGESKDLRLSVELPPSRPPLVIGDATRLRQILLNLLSNAIKFTHRGEVRVIVETDALPPVGSEMRGLMVRIRVQDSGIGIAPEARDRLFKPFSQADQSIGREFGGTGLGLAISERLVSAMGGRIAIDDERAEGSEFWFEIPFPLAEVLTLAEPQRKGRTRIRKSGVPRRVLLAEDVATNQELAVALLEHEGHEVHIVDNGAAAVQAVQESRFDIVFMDVQMPVMDGIEATRRIRGLGGPYASLPIVAVTANVIAGDVARYIDAGMSDHVGKPFKLSALSEAIERWCPPPPVPRAA